MLPWPAAINYRSVLTPYGIKAFPLLETRKEEFKRKILQLIKYA